MLIPSHPRSFMRAVHDRLQEQLDGLPFHPDHAALLQATLAGPCAQALAEPLGNPLSALYLLARAQGCPLGEQAQRVAAFCLLHILSLDLFDDVQDEELAETAHADAGDALAINSAITLAFMATDQLHRALALEPDPTRRLRYLELHSRVGLEAVGGQHRDLLGVIGAATPAEVLRMQQAKTSSVVLVLECGALLGGCDAPLQARYRYLGEQLARFIQVRDDLQDIFGRDRSPDLITAKNSYPVACFLASAEPPERRRFEQLMAELPASQGEVRELLYQSGAVLASAQVMQQSRAAMHAEVAAIDISSARLRVLLDIIDTLAASVFRPPPIERSEPMWRPAGLWHERVRAELGRFVARNESLGLPAPPELRPWHHPQWLYEPTRKIIFYPDIEGLADELLPYHADLMGARDRDEMAALWHDQIPCLVAHEMFHFWRDARGRLSGDHWHEEWAANRLAVAYCQRYAPAALVQAAKLARRMVKRHAERLDEQLQEVLARCDKPSAVSRGYDMDALGAAVTSMEMVRRMQRQPGELAALMTELLGVDEQLALSA